MKNLFKISIVLAFLSIALYGQQYRGIFVGINDYPGYFNDLQNCVSDALAMRSMLVYNKHWNYSNCHVLLDGSASKNNIWHEILIIPKSDTITTIFSYAGHGDSYTLPIPGAGPDGMLIPEGDWFYWFSPVDLEDLFTTSYNNYAAFLDCCGSGVFPRDMNHGVISSACAANEFAYENYYAHGIYSYWIEMGLVNRYHDNAEGVHTYAAPCVVSASGSRQHPVLKDNFSGNLNIYNGGLSKTSANVKEQTNIVEESTINEFRLDNNYPNPFNPTTAIEYQIPVDNFVSLVVFNSLGQEIEKLVNKYQSKGKYSVSFDASGLPSGIYYYKINVGEFSEVKKMILTK